MNIVLQTPCAGLVGIQPDAMSPVCPLLFGLEGNVTTHAQRAAARAYLSAEGWIEKAEGILWLAGISVEEMAIAAQLIYELLDVEAI